MALQALWRTITATKALENSSGKLETTFFESVYRVTYLAAPWMESPLFIPPEQSAAKNEIVESKSITLASFYEAFTELNPILLRFSTSDFGLLYRLYSTSVKLILGLLFVSEMWFLIGDDVSVDDIIEQANSTVIQVIAFIRYRNMMQHKEIFKKLAAAMESPTFDVSTNSRKALIDYYSKQNEWFLKRILGLGTCILAVWYVYPLVDDLEYNLTMVVRLPVDYRTPSRYPVAYAVTLVALTYVGSFIMVNDLILQAYLLHILCQFTVLVDCFENILADVEKDFKGFEGKLINNDDFKAKYMTRLGLLIDQHKLILDNTLELRQILSAPMLLQVSASSLQICFAGYQVALTLAISVTKFLMSLLYLGYNMCQLFIFCRWCDEIKTQSENIRNAIYCSGWEDGWATVPGFRQRLLLVAMRASKPVVLTAGGLYELSLSSFTDLVKTSYSALTVLLRLRQD